MTIPGSAPFAGAPYGAVPVVPVIGPEGGPYRLPVPTLETQLFSLARTASTSGPDVTNPGWKGLIANLQVSANPGGAQTLSLIVEGKETSGSTYYPLLTVPASAAPGGQFLIYPGAGTVAVEGFAQVRGIPLPDVFRVRVVHSGVGSWTYYSNFIYLP